ncbi:TniQ family protein [Bacillus mycoides]|uniref:TniQ family protein n=1 Tax=Bacillus mycoides TaxID=1405 RepID=UPI0034639F99
MFNIEFINFEETLSTKCSKLYALQPIGIGKVGCESLTSYISRLAQEHSISTGVLINKILAPNMKKEYLVKSGKNGGNRFYDGAKSINGYGTNTLEFSQLLQSLTLQDNLKALTLMDWKSIISLRSLLKKNLSWCPSCISNWRDKGSQIYYPLSWYISSMKLCLIHNTYLSNVCPHCNKNPPILHRSIINGYCSLCKGWLGKYQPASNILDINQENFKSKNIEELLTLDTVNLKKVSQSLQKLIEEVTNGNVTEFARLMSIPKVTMWDWVKGERVPSLEGLLRICFQLEISIKELLTNGKVFFDCAQGKAKEKILLQSTISKRRKINPDLLQKKLEGYIESDENFSLSEISKRIGYDRKLLYQHCPEQCKRIVESYKKYCEKQSLERKETVASLVQVAVEELIRNDIYPSRRSVEKRLGKSAVLREKYIQQVWKEIIHN